MSPRLHSFSLASLLVVSLLATGCGGGGGGSQDDGSTLILAVTPGTHADLLEGQATIESVELLGDLGTSTGNLLPAPVRAPVVSESTESDWLALRSPPEGRYTELRIRYATSGQTARHRGGDPVELRVDNVEQRVAISGRGLHHRGGCSWLELRHRSDVDADQDGPRRWRWWPRLDSRAGDGLFFHDSRVTVQSIVSATEFRFSAVFGCVGGLRKVEFAVLPDAIVIAESDGPISREELFARLVPEVSVVKILGRLGVDGVVQVRHLVLRHRTPHDDDVEVLARITNLDRPALLADIVILSVREGQAQVDQHFGNSTDRRVGISLRGASIRRSGGRDRLLIADLAVGQQVRVEFKDFPQPEPMPVESITLEDDFAQFEGRVADVTGLPQFFLAAPRGDDHLFRRGCLNPTVRVQLSAATRVFINDERNVVGVEQIVVGARVRVRGTLVEPGVVSATSVRLREECRGHGSGGHGGNSGPGGGH